MIGQASKDRRMLGSRNVFGTNTEVIYRVVWGRIDLRLLNLEPNVK